MTILGENYLKILIFCQHGHNLIRLGLQTVATGFSQPNNLKSIFTTIRHTKYFEDVNIETKNLEIIYRVNPSLSCKTIITSDQIVPFNIRGMNFNLQ